MIGRDGLDTVLACGTVAQRLELGTNSHLTQCLALAFETLNKVAPVLDVNSVQRGEEASAKWFAPHLQRRWETSIPNVASSGPTRQVTNRQRR